jgi:hypothetical protein
VHDTKDGLVAKFNRRSDTRRTGSYSREVRAYQHQLIAPQRS